MNVGQLKAILSTVPDDYPVILQADPEGNSYDEAYATSYQFYWDQDSQQIYGGEELDGDHNLIKCFVISP